MTQLINMLLQHQYKLFLNFYQCYASYVLTYKDNINKDLGFENNSRYYNTASEINVQALRCPLPFLAKRYPYAQTTGTLPNP